MTPWRCSPAPSFLYDPHDCRDRGLRGHSSDFCPALSGEHDRIEQLLCDSVRASLPQPSTPTQGCRPTGAHRPPHRGPSTYRAPPPSRSASSDTPGAAEEGKQVMGRLCPPLPPRSLPAWRGGTRDPSLTSSLIFLSSSFSFRLISSSAAFLRSTFRLWKPVRYSLLPTTQNHPAFSDRGRLPSRPGARLASPPPLLVESHHQPPLAAARALLVLPAAHGGRTLLLPRLLPPAPSAGTPAAVPTAPGPGGTQPPSPRTWRAPDPGPGVPSGVRGVCFRRGSLRLRSSSVASQQKILWRCLVRPL